MLVINRSQIDGVICDWKVAASGRDVKTEWFKLAEPYQQYEVYLHMKDDKHIAVHSKHPLPDKLTVTITVINDDTNACIELDQTNRNKQSRLYFSGGVNYYYTRAYEKCMSEWKTKDGFFHFRVVISDNTVVGIKDEITVNQVNAFNSALATDVKLIVGGQTIKANKYVLMVHSDVFRAMFERWEGRDDDEVEIKDVEYEPMLAFVMAMYSGNVKLQNVGSALKVMNIADKYNVPAVKNACGQYIGKTMTSSNVLECLIEADKLSFVLLTKACLKTLLKLDKNELAKLKRTKEWKRLNRNTWFSAWYQLCGEL